MMIVHPYHLIAAAMLLGVSSTLAFAPIAQNKNTIPSTSGSSESSSSFSMIGQLFDFMGGSQTVHKKEQRTDLKNQIRSLAQGTKNGLSASEEKREMIAGLVGELEKINPTSKLTSDDKLNGSWNLIYTTNEGSSAGKLGPFVGGVEQLIEMPDDYINFVRIGPLEGALTATWDTLSANKWQVNFQTLEFKLFGLPLVKSPLQAQGIWRKTYLDDDFRILYAIGGKNTEKENIYILAK